VRDLKALIGEFTQFSRLPKAVVRRLDLAELVRETLAPYQSGPPEGVRLALEASTAAVEGDADQLRRVLLNVVHNGLEAMQARGGELRVQVRADGERAQVRVRDQGTGVEDVERIFEPYYTTKVKGTGLGLLIARQIVEEHAGRIRVESEPGVGTEVTIELPAVS
jgi:two-component system NtrC family sensor kinase